MSRSSDTLKIETRSLIELCRPPDGYHFVRGAWATHDLDLRTLSEYIAPSLTGSVATEKRQRQLEGRVIPEQKKRSLLIFPCVERQTFNGFVPWCHIYPVGGRRQHSKFAILQFESERGGKIRSRVIVTSANLTHAGVCTNRELLLWGEVGHLQKRASIMATLLHEFHALAKDAYVKTEGQSLLLEMKKFLPTEELPVIKSSISAPRPLLRDIKVRKPVRRLVVISPPFASDSDDGVVNMLSKYIGPKTSVEIYTGASFMQGTSPTPQNAPMFSTSVLSALRHCTEKVQVFAVPELIPDEDEPDDRPPLKRRLHAKYVALVTEDGELHQFIGSANFTRSALEGKNRELMIHGGGTEAELDSLLRVLHAKPVDRTDVRPSPVVTDRSQLDDPMQLRAVFTIDSAESPERSCWRGRLQLIGDEMPVAITYRGQALQSVTEQSIWLRDTDTCLKVKMADDRWDCIPIHITASDPKFWQRIDQEDKDVGPDQSWMHLLLDLRRGPTRGGAAGQAVVQVSSGSSNDGFSIPLEQRLTLLARHRHRLRVFSDMDELEKRLIQYFEKEEEAHQVAHALLSSTTGLAMDHRDPLLVALRDAMHLFPTKERAGHE